MVCIDATVCRCVGIGLAPTAPAIRAILEVHIELVLEVGLAFQDQVRVTLTCGVASSATPLSLAAQVLDAHLPPKLGCLGVLAYRLWHPRTQCASQQACMRW